MSAVRRGGRSGRAAATRPSIVDASRWVGHSPAPISRARRPRGRFIALDFRAGARPRIARTRAAAERRVDPAAARRARARSRPGCPPRAVRARANLEALARGQTAVVATGQQVGLFLGPLYGFYKAASAIAVARALEAESGVRCRAALLAADRGPRLRRDRLCRRSRAAAARRVTLALADGAGGRGARLGRAPAARPRGRSAARQRSPSCCAPARPRTRPWRSCARTTPPAVRIGAGVRRRCWPRCSPTRGS